MRSYACTRAGRSMSNRSGACGLAFAKATASFAERATALSRRECEARAASAWGWGPKRSEKGGAPRALRNADTSQVTARSLLALGLLAVLGTVYGQTVPAPVTLRFHHLHYRVADPGAALGDAADAFEGTRTILQGIGVGVRVGREYVLFDRVDTTNRSRPRARTPADAYAEAVRWLGANRVLVRPLSLAETAVARTVSDATLDHVAFAADDPGPVIAALTLKPVLEE